MRFPEVFFFSHTVFHGQKRCNRFFRFISFILLVTPALCTPETTPFPRPASIKGLQVQMADDALALGIHHAGVNINITALFDAQKRPENPKINVDGFEFSFQESYLKSIDRQIKPLSDHGVLIYLIVIAYPSKNPAIDSVVIHPAAKPDHRYSVAGFNAVTAEGQAWLKAVSQLMAQRWSGANPTSGRVWGWIIGNEVNSHFMWLNMGKQPLDAAVAHYARAFRIIHESVRNASAHARLYISFDHHWGQRMHGISPEEACGGREFLDAFTTKTKDLDWHVAWHPYPEDLGNPRAWMDRTVTSDVSTNKITFKNLEVLCEYLRRPEMLYKDEPRRVILSEQGFQTLLQPDGETLQAAAFAYAWEKCRRLPLVDAFIYHRHVDHAKEGGLRLGLWRNAPHSVVDPHSKKEIWSLMQKAGTPEWDTAAAHYLPVTNLTSWDQLKGEKNPAK
ncbi:MAG: hypothetical protein RI957_526 [Verrucomicrobiota bacterium]|jgi:hypothetical protein